MIDSVSNQALSQETPLPLYKETNFKESPIGKIPQDWDVAAFGETFTYKKGKKPSVVSSEYSKGVLPYLSTQYLRENGSHNFATVSNAVVTVNEGDLILLWDGSNAGEFFLGKKGILSSTMVKIDRNNETYNAKFLYYLLKTKEQYIKSQTKGTGIPHVDGTALERLVIPSPKLAEQEKIVEILGVVDSAIELADRVIAKTERLKRGLMQQLLAHGIGHTEYKQTPIGKMPQQWNVVKFEELILKLKRGPSKQTNNKEIGVVYLTSDYITDNGFLKFENLKYLDENLVDDVGKYLLEQNDLIVNCVNSFEKIGKVAVFEGFSKRVAIGFNNFALTLEKSVDPLFLKYILSQELYKAIFQSIGKAAVQQVSFSSKDLFRVQVPLPPTILEQRKIAEILSSVDNKIQIEKIQKANLEQIKKGMMGLLLTGKIRIKVD